MDERAYRLVELRSLDEWPENLVLASPRYVLLLACDASKLTVEAISGVAETMLRQGLVYVCCWGLDCERVHDIFDEVICEVVPLEEGTSTIMTTWHDGETFEDVVDFFRDCAEPAESDTGCRDWIIACVPTLPRPLPPARSCRSREAPGSRCKGKRPSVGGCV